MDVSGSRPSCNMGDILLMGSKSSCFASFHLFISFVVGFFGNLELILGIGVCLTSGCVLGFSLFECIRSRISCVSSVSRFCLGILNSRLASLYLLGMREVGRSFLCAVCCELIVLSLVGCLLLKEGLVKLGRF